ncbi:MAG TPA: hypothetical protein VFX85_05640 [Solirubrobacterales bacterium]|nr:hypothetical protein [Solirubrobacterales bacterium]
MLKKTILLAAALAAFVAFAVPATASADKWAKEGISLGAGQEITQAYEGFLQFNTGATGTFGCDVTITIKTNGPSEAQVTSFSPTTGTCVGTVAFKGCKLIADKSNVPFNVSNASTPLGVTRVGGGNITIHNEYEAGSCAGKQTTSHLEFATISAAVEGTNPISKLTISGTSTVGVPASGSLTPESPAVLGIIN